MEVLVLLAIWLIFVFGGAFFGFGAVYLLVRRMIAFIFTPILLVGGVILMLVGILAAIMGAAGMVVDALNPHNPGFAVAIGGLIAFLLGSVTFGASIGGFVAGLFKKSPPANQNTPPSPEQFFNR